MNGRKANYLSSVPLANGRGLAYPLPMGLIDRAFGADKNSMLFNKLALHWRMVASHHENHVKKNHMESDQEVIFKEIQARSSKLADLANSSLKGFGVSSPDQSAFLNELNALSQLQNEITVTTDKEHWLPEAIVFTKLILGGEKRMFQNRQYWFSD